MSHTVTIRDVVKSYGDFHAVDHISLKIESGEFFTLLGPSGCGKTTPLRMIAGFNTIDEGEILFDDQVINKIPTYQRNIGMVFQNYAVFPHMSVADNVAYGLKARKIKGKEKEERMLEALRMMRIDNLKDHLPFQMSGGQQQRIALARAIVIHPGILLMDEPLSNLDAKLRLEMRTTIRKLQKDLGITTVYVTHDQDEALAISDRIAVCNNGRVEQLGDPYEIYNKPANTFVANFIGTSNFIPGKAYDGYLAVLDQEKIPCRLKDNYQGDIQIAVRPEQVKVTAPEDSGIAATVTSAVFLGTRYEYEFTLPNGQVIQINEYNKKREEAYELNKRVGLKFELNQMSVFTGDGREALL